MRVQSYRHVQLKENRIALMAWTRKNSDDFFEFYIEVILYMYYNDRLTFNPFIHTKNQ